MDDKTLQALNILADKLGTTAEYLWGVLIKQAFISGVVDAITLLSLAVAVVISGIFIYGKGKVPPKTQDDPYPHAEWDSEIQMMVWAFYLLAAAFVLVAISINLSTVVAAFMNPEYWALKQILK